ncbi:MAG TPA: DUF3892 domain-containing protein [Gemmatimonadaceae bacterium]|jgi:hypothetical protein|nr:DUF3892 domain-containing protein [Gemmatimonadaceae bacterium]
MPTDLQVQCIRKPDRWNEHERIQFIGGMTNGKYWWANEDDAIAMMNAGTFTFFTFVNGVRATVQIAQHSLLAPPFLTTHPDGTKVNNLLYLPECP